jgi:hypothetical protein
MEPERGGGYFVAILQWKGIGQSRQRERRGKIAWMEEGGREDKVNYLQDLPRNC